MLQIIMNYHRDHPRLILVYTTRRCYREVVSVEWFVCSVDRGHQLGPAVGGAAVDPRRLGPGVAEGACAAGAPRARGRAGGARGQQALRPYVSPPGNVSPLSRASARSYCNSNARARDIIKVATMFNYYYFFQFETLSAPWLFCSCIRIQLDIVIQSGRNPTKQFFWKLFQLNYFAKLCSIDDNIGNPIFFRSIHFNISVVIQ